MRVNKRGETRRGMTTKFRAGQHRSSLSALVLVEEQTGEQHPCKQMMS